MIECDECWTCSYTAVFSQWCNLGSHQPRHSHQPCSAPRVGREDPSDQLCASQFVSSRDVDLKTFAKHWGNFAVRQFALAFVSHDEVTDYFASPEGGGLTKEEVDTIPGWYMLKRFLDGQEDSEDGDTIASAAMFEMLGHAQNLLHDYAAVGVLEEWESTLSLFNAALLMPGMDWHKDFEQSGKKNVDVRFEEDKHEALRKALMDVDIKKFLWLDLLLYDYALEVFHEQKKIHGIV